MAPLVRATASSVEAKSGVLARISRSGQAVRRPRRGTRAPVASGWALSRTSRGRPELNSFRPAHTCPRTRCRSGRMRTPSTPAAGTAARCGRLRCIAGGCSDRRRFVTSGTRRQRGGPRGPAPRRRSGPLSVTPASAPLLGQAQGSRMRVAPPTTHGLGRKRGSRPARPPKGTGPQRGGVAGGQDTSRGATPAHHLDRPEECEAAARLRHDDPVPRPGPRRRRVSPAPRRWRSFLCVEDRRPVALDLDPGRRSSAAPGGGLLSITARRVIRGP